MLSFKTFLATAALTTLTHSLPQAPAAPAANPTKWTLQDDYFSISPSDFFSRFDFFTQADPTQSNVTYVSQPTAEQQGLIGFYPTTNPSAQTSQFQSPTGSGPSSWAAYMSVDMSTPQKAMRNSVRISSKKQYEPPLLTIVSVDHVPLGPGTWPSFWMLGQGTWPAGGEIDIIESFGNPSGQGAQNYAASTQGSAQSPNANSMTLHASAGCALQSNGSGTSFQGTLLQQNCDTYATPGNQGCQIKSPFGTAPAAAPAPNRPRDTNDIPEHFATAGSEFNAQGGGVYATSWTSDGIHIWFFPPNAVPPSLTANGTDPNVAEFGTPLASFTGSGCDWQTHFTGMSLIFNIALCGQAITPQAWSSSGRAQMTGKDSCEAYVYDKDGVGESWWGVRGLRVYGGA